MWYLCESVDLTKLTPGGQVVAFGPQAVYLLEKNNVAHFCVSTPHSENRLYGEREEYFLEQLEWIDRFEDWLTNKLSGFGIVNPGLINAHYYQLVFLADSLHIHSSVISDFFKSCRPDKINYFRNGRPKASYSPYALHKYGNILIQDITQEFSRINGIDFDFIETEKENSGSSVLFLEKIIGIAKRSSKLLCAKPLYEYFKYRKFNRVFAPDKNINVNSLVLNAGVASIDLVIRELLKSGGDVYFKDHSGIYAMHNFLGKKCINFRKDTQRSRSITNAFVKIADEIQKSDEVFGWLDKASYSMARKVLLPYLKYFLTTICAQNLLEVEEISIFLKEKKIDFTVSRSSSEDFAISSLIAAKEQKVKRVIFQHGMSPLDWKTWHITELKLADVYFTTDTLSDNYFKQAQKSDYAKHSQVFQSPHYLKFLRSLSEKSKLKDDLVVYVPMRGFWGFRCLNNMRYPLTWYFRLQKALIELFGNHKELRVIFKLGSGQDWAEESTVRYINESGYKNITVRRDDFFHYINSGAKIITDYPSSALYEAASVGIPVMSLCYSKLPVWPAARSLFGNSIQVFTSLEEAIKLTGIFLDSPKDTYIVKDLEVNESAHFMDTLLNLKR